MAMKYIHPKKYKGIKSFSEIGQNIVRNRVEEYCLKCSEFMGQEHDFEECQMHDVWDYEKSKVSKKKTCPFPHTSTSLISPIVKCEIATQ